MFASIAAAAPLQLLQAAGFQDRFTAQRAFFTRARHTYNFWCEKSQIRLVQGSMILTSAVTGFGAYRDVTFWLYNAIRIATNMGLHRRYVGF